jgi:hypothetical protein
MLVGLGRLCYKPPVRRHRRVTSAQCVRALALVLALAVPAHAAETGTVRLDTRHVGAQVLIDGAVVGVAPLPGPWALPVGQHKIEVRPAGQAPLVETVQVAAGQEVRVALAPAAARSDAEAGPVRTAVVHTGAGFSLATAGYVTFGVGAAAGITAVLFGLGAQSKADDAAALDRTNPSNTRASQLALSDEAERSALWANVLGGVGVVAGLSGVAMVLLASDGPFGDGFSVAPTPGGVVFGGAF